MRRALFFLIFLCGFPPWLFAQRYYSDEVPRYELGLQFDIANIDVGASGGLGLRFHYNFNEHVALDSELFYGSNSSLSTGSQASQTTFLTGARVGQRVANSGF